MLVDGQKKGNEKESIVEGNNFPVRRSTGNDGSAKVVVLGEMLVTKRFVKIIKIIGKTHLRRDEEKVHRKDADNGDAVQRVVDLVEESLLSLGGR